MNKSILPAFKIAQFDKRVVAAVIDIFLLVYVVNILIILQVMHVGANIIQVLIKANLVGLLLYAFKDLFSGQSPGKNFVGIAISNFDSDKKNQSKLRYALRNLITLILLPIELFSIQGDEKHRSIADKLFNTIVIESSNRMRLRSKIIWILSLILIIVLVFNIVDGGN